MRCVHESLLYENNCVVTLTYHPDALPSAKFDPESGELTRAEGSIAPEHAVEFMKRLRERERYKHAKTNIRSYGCAEYGCQNPKCGNPNCQHTMRPHYHIILFNHHFEDRQQIPFKPGYYTSEELTDTWGHGSTQLMDLTFESAAYVARYVMKKLTGPREKEYGDKLPEQPVCISRGEGIGKKWYEEWKEEIYKHDKVYRNKKTGERVPMTPPKYYDRRMEIENPEKYQKIKNRRKRQRQQKELEIEKQIEQGNTTNALDGFGSRQKAYIDCQEAQMRQLKRGYENES